MTYDQPETARFFRLKSHFPVHSFKPAMLHPMFSELQFRIIPYLLFLTSGFCFSIYSSGLFQLHHHHLTYRVWSCLLNDQNLPHISPKPQPNPYSNRPFQSKLKRAYHRVNQNPENRNPQIVHHPSLRNLWNSQSERRVQVLLLRCPLKRKKKQVRISQNTSPLRRDIRRRAVVVEVRLGKDLRPENLLQPNPQRKVVKAEEIGRGPRIRTVMESHRPRQSRLVSPFLV